MTTQGDEEPSIPVSPPYRIEIEALAVAMERVGTETNGVADHLDPARALGRVAIAAAGIGIFDWDLRTGVLAWDERLLEMFGYDRESFGGTIESFDSAVHPDDVPLVHRAIREAIETAGEYAAEYRVVRADGVTRWVTARGLALPGPDGTAVRLLGAAFDSTAERDHEVRVARVLEAMPTAFFSVDTHWRFTYVNSSAEQLLQRHRDELLGKDLWDLFPEAVGSRFEKSYRLAVETGEPVNFDAYYPAPLDAWYEVHAWPTPDGLSVYFLDVSGRRRDAALAAAAARRAQLASTVAVELSETLEAEEAVGRLAKLVVPVLADWSVVTLVEPGEPRRGPRLRDVGSWHHDPGRRALVDRYATQRLASLTPQSFLNRAARTGETVVVPGDATASMLEVLVPGEASELLRHLDPGNAVVLPLRGRGRTVGVLSLFHDRGRAPLTDEDLQLAADVAGRAGLALDNARLYKEQLTLAEGLQRSLLTKPPSPDHLQIEVRYEPAAEAARVGGDWYDAFLQPDGATVLVIGDVVGHDVLAAAEMGQVRSILRGIAVATGGAPAQVLGTVDKAMRTLQTESIATAVVARLEQTPEELAQHRTRVRWSNAGHPMPMLLHADGTVEPLKDGKPDPLLGIMPDAPRHETEVVLERDSTLLLYTDGLVERRDMPVRDGMARLEALLAELAPKDLGLAELCDELLTRVLPGRREDDVALVAVRLHPQDEPRPPEAGPVEVPPDVPEDPAAPEQQA
ncbi:SpoIIE family protein phosphatase [Cellulomonas sp. 73-145]|uniref:SpoIIE family protein phosphatase n=1 Tax=Cellulomonas sp. 73-145 TaxID=1895739 RepID=UPI000A863A36|nr:SpoIIE family protein phosphatase [Cellulomonas sp. 73-145]